ncbi:hypothetical protein PsorP6_010134 [Peronosclerospora sorghi]|uniref:Uncharacterized protein n=1 Tax=Peronosclerospora sorghi TaxID=230839 RepID=A0ACC0VUA2_9STRA|nr:hypothetical protein PsorP6_010134 [Peronosclerospora sorghi]
MQALMKRRDWKVVIRQPLGIIPGGSGSGLASSIASKCQERPKPVNLAYILAKGTSHGLDIASMRNGKETVYSFLSMAWASIADVDLDSESCAVSVPCVSPSRT